MIVNGPFGANGGERFCGECHRASSNIRLKVRIDRGIAKAVLSVCGSSGREL
jgi:hypothetical protein